MTDLLPVHERALALAAHSLDQPLDPRNDQQRFAAALIEVAWGIAVDQPEMVRGIVRLIRESDPMAQEMHLYAAQFVAEQGSGLY